MGEAAIFRMLSDFYAELGCPPIRPMFPGDLEESSKKSARFFVQLLGGPPFSMNNMVRPGCGRGTCLSPSMKTRGWFGWLALKRHSRMPGPNMASRRNTWRGSGCSWGSFRSGW